MARFTISIDGYQGQSDAEMDAIAEVVEALASRVSLNYEDTKDLDLLSHIELLAAKLLYSTAAIGLGATEEDVTTELATVLQHLQLLVTVMAVKGKLDGD